MKCQNTYIEKLKFYISYAHDYYELLNKQKVKEFLKMSDCFWKIIETDWFVKLPKYVKEILE